MENLKYLKKITDPEIALRNREDEERVKEAYGDDPPPILKNPKPAKFEDGEYLFAVPTLKALFEILTENRGFIFYGVIVKNDYITLCGYRHAVQVDGKTIEVDPGIKINDFKVLEARVGAKPGEMKQIYKEMNEKLQSFMKDKLSYSDIKAYDEDFEEYRNPKNERLEKYREGGNYLDLE